MILDWFRKFSAFGYQKSNGIITIIFTLIFLAFMMIVLPKAASASEVYSAGIGSIDRGFGNSGVEIISILEQYGESGRSAYLYARWTFDLIFPLIYTSFIFVFTSFFGNKLQIENENYKLLNLLIVIGMIFDYLENTFATILILTINSPSIFLASVLSGISVIKWIFVSGGFLLVVLMPIIHFFSKQNKESTLLI